VVNILNRDLPVDFEICEPQILLPDEKKQYSPHVKDYLEYKIQYSWKTGITG
jgi:hypothetical protein